MGAASSSGSRRARRRSKAPVHSTKRTIRAASSRRVPRPRLGPAPSDLVIVSRALATFGERLKPTQASAGRGRVIVDRRAEEPEGTGHVERERRRPSSASVMAALRVLGFAVVPSGRPAAGPRPKKPVRR